MTLDERRALGARAKAADLPYQYGLAVVYSDGTEALVVTVVCDRVGDDVPDPAAPGFVGFALAELERRTGKSAGVVRSLLPHVDFPGAPGVWLVWMTGPTDDIFCPPIAKAVDRAESLILALEATKP